MEFEDPLASDATSPMGGPHMGVPRNDMHATVIPIVCHCGEPAEFVVHPNMPHVRRSVCQQRVCHHDVWLKRCPTRAKKAMIIRKLQGFVSKLKAALLEKGHAVRASEAMNMKLMYAIASAKRRSRARMLGTTATMVVMFTALLAHVLT